MSRVVAKKLYVLRQETINVTAAQGPEGHVAVGALRRESPGKITLRLKLGFFPFVPSCRLFSPKRASLLIIAGLMHNTYTVYIVKKAPEC